MHGVVARGIGDVGQAALPWKTPGDEPVVQLDRRGKQHRLRERRLDLHQPAGVLGPRRRDPPGTAEFDARRDLVHAVRQQRRRQRVAGVPGVGTPVEGELEWLPRSMRPPPGCGRARSCVHRLLFAHAVDTVESIGGGVAYGIEPAAATGRVAPPFGERALGVVPEEEVTGPLARRSAPLGCQGRRRGLGPP